MIKSHRWIKHTDWKSRLRSQNDCIASKYGIQQVQKALSPLTINYQHMRNFYILLFKKNYIIVKKKEISNP